MTEKIIIYLGMEKNNGLIPQHQQLLQDLSFGIINQNQNPIIIISKFLT
jgi:hypothetical protein